MSKRRIVFPFGGNIISCPDDESATWRDLFFKNAFFLYENRKAILSDVRMSLTPLPFGNNLAYTGTNGLRNATLGVYLEWWESCERAVIREKDGQIRSLTYFIAGSPLSGSNHCSAVRKDGTTESVRFSPFLGIWNSFAEINARYAEARQHCQVYTLEETLSNLRQESDH